MGRRYCVTCSATCKRFHQFDEPLVAPCTANVCDKTATVTNNHRQRCWPIPAEALQAKAKPEKYISKGADILPCGRYRYLLWREWRGTASKENWTWFGVKDGAGHKLDEPKTVLFVMLNPSTADGEQDHATIRRCVGFAKTWKYDRMEVVNLYAFRATKPHDLWAARDDRHAPRNQSVIHGAARRVGIIIAAWGAHGAEGDQGETVRGWMYDPTIHHLGLTKDGHPKHTLYLPNDTKPQVLR